MLLFILGTCLGVVVAAVTTVLVFHLRRERQNERLMNLLNERRDAEQLREFRKRYRAPLKVLANNEEPGQSSSRFVIYPGSHVGAFPNSVRRHRG